MDFKVNSCYSNYSIDVAVAGITIREDRSKQVDLLKPYYHSELLAGKSGVDSDITGC